MRSLYVWVGVAGLCAILGLGWLGQKVLGQPDPPPGSRSEESMQNYADSADLPRPPNLPAPVTAGMPPPTVQNVEPPSVPGPNRLGGNLAPTPPTIIIPAAASSSGSQNLPPPSDVRPSKIESAVTAEWVGPSVAKLGQPMACQIVVCNRGTAAVHQVVVRHPLPEGVEHRGTEPAATTSTEGGRHLSWSLGTLEAGQTRTLKVMLVTQQRGPLHCHATVSYSSSLALNVLVREPLLALKVKGPERVIAGEEAVFHITLSNPGDGLTENISVNAILPEGLEHPRGKNLKINNVVPLAPGETRSLRLVCLAREGGQQSISVTATAEANLQATDLAMVEVVIPKLDLAVTGPKLRYIDRHAVYTLKVSNPGSSPASSVTLTEMIPAGFRLHQASGSARYDKDTRQVTWIMGELPPGQNREVSLDLVATAAGDHKLVGMVTSARGVKTEAEIRTRVEGLSKLEVDVTDSEDPVEVGAETTYKIRVLNSGTKMESNIQVICRLPEQMEFVKGNMRFHVEGRTIVFDPLPNLAPNGEVIYSVTAKGMQPGNLRFNVQVRADSLSEPILREEVTRVYSDEVPAR
jgi:uncharacterized repeat protein (TIGR01451 family)